MYREFYDTMPFGDQPLKVIFCEGEDTVARMHHHNFHELVIVFGGRGVYRTPQKEYKLRSGDVFFLPPGMYHEYKEPEDLFLANILFWPDRLDLNFHDLKNSPGYRIFFELEPAARLGHDFSGRMTLDGKSLDIIRKLTWQMHDELERREAGYLGYCISLLSQIITVISRSFQAAEVVGRSTLSGVERAIQFMNEHCQEKISRAHLASVCGMSESTFYRIFLRLFHKAPMEYLTELRLNRAEEMLRSGSLPIYEIALLCGFGDSNYFCWKFKQRFGISPNRYRKEESSTRSYTIS